MSDSSEEISIEVCCPVETCKKSKEITIPKYLFDNKRMIMLKLPVHSGVCCEHEFIVFISTKGYTIRGYEKIDTTVNLSQIESSEERDRLNLQDLLSKYGSLATSSVIIALLLKKPIVLLRTKYEKNLSAKFFNLFLSMLSEKNQLGIGSVSHILDSEFKKAKIKESLVISPTGLVANTPWQDFSDEYIREVLNKALNILDINSQGILLQNELDKIINQAKFISDIIIKDEIFEEDLILKLEKYYSLKITNSYLKMLKIIVAETFEGNIKRIKIRSFSKLKEGLW